MIFTWIFILVGLFMVAVTYYETTGPLMSILLEFQAQGAPADFIALVMKCYHTAFIILPVGIILYGIIRTLRKEPDTYKV